MFTRQADLIFHFSRSLIFRDFSFFMIFLIYPDPASSFHISCEVGFKNKIFNTRKKSSLRAHCSCLDLVQKTHTASCWLPRFYLVQKTHFEWHGRWARRRNWVGVTICGCWLSYWVSLTLLLILLQRLKALQNKEDGKRRKTKGGTSELWWMSHSCEVAEVSLHAWTKWAGCEDLPVAVSTVCPWKVCLVQVMEEEVI